MATWHEYLKAEGTPPEWPYPIKFGEESEVEADVLVLGGGIAIKLKDGMVICHKAMVDLMKKIADSTKTPYQLEILERGGTDTGMIQQTGGGCIAGALSVPTRYGHSAVETVDLADVEGGVQIMVGLIETKLD